MSYKTNMEKAKKKKKKKAKNSDQNSKVIHRYFLNMFLKVGFSKYSAGVVHACIEVQIKVANSTSTVVKLNVSCKIYSGGAKCIR